MRRGRTIPSDRARSMAPSPRSVSDDSDPGAGDVHRLSARSKQAVRLYRCAARKYEANEMKECLELLEQALMHNENLQVARDLRDKVSALHRVGRSPAWANCSVTRSCPTLFQASSSSSASEWSSDGAAHGRGATTAVDGPCGVGGESNDRPCVPMPFASISPGTRRTLFSEHRGSRHSSPDSVKSTASGRSRVHSSRRRSSGSRRSLGVHKSVDSVPFFQLGKSSSFSEGVPTSRGRAAASHQQQQRQALMRTKSQSFAQQMSALSPMAPRNHGLKSSRDSKRLRLSLDSVGSTGPFHFNGMSETLDDDESHHIHTHNRSSSRPDALGASSNLRTSRSTGARRLASQSDCDSFVDTEATGPLAAAIPVAPEVAALHDLERTTGYSPTFTARSDTQKESCNLSAAGDAPTPVATHSPILPRSRQRTPKLQDESPDSLLEFRRSTSEASLHADDGSFISPQPFPRVLSTPKVPGSACSAMSGIEGPALTESPEVLTRHDGSKIELGTVRRRFGQLEVEEKDPAMSDARSISMEEIDKCATSPADIAAARPSPSTLRYAADAQHRASQRNHSQHASMPMPMPTPAKRSDAGLCGGIPRRQQRKAKQRDRLSACPPVTALSNTASVGMRAQRPGKENGVSYAYRGSAVKQCAKTPARQLGAPPCFETPTRDQQFQMASAQFDTSIVVAALRKAGIDMLALDFDNTLIDTHTKGQFRGAVEDLIIRPVFRAVIPAVLKAGITLSIVTFSPQVHVVKSLLAHTFPDCDLGVNTFVCGALPSSMVTSRSVSPGGVPLCCSPRQTGKRPHIRMVCEEHAWATGCDVLLPAQVLLVDDDKANIDSAKRAGINAVWFRADWDPSAAECQLYVDLQTPV